MKTLKIRVKLILNCPQAHAITYTLSHTLHFGSPADGEFAWSGGLHIPYQVNLFKSINETTSTTKIFWHTHCALRSFCKLFAGRSKINLFISWLPTVSFNHCVTRGNNKLFHKGSTMCLTVAAGECTTHFCPWEPGTSLTFTRTKSECPAQVQMGGVWGFQMTGA